MHAPCSVKMCVGVVGVLFAMSAQAVNIADPDDTLVINEPTNVVVESGTVKWMCKLEGNGTITKSGNGTLDVTHTNTNFNGEWIIQAGTLHSGSAMGKKIPFFGNGKITIHASTEHDSGVFVQTSVLTNAIDVIGASSQDHPALKAASQSSYAGPITADSDLFIYQTSYAGGGSRLNDKLIFEYKASITAPGQTVSIRPNAQFNFASAPCPIVCETLDITFSGDTGLGSVRLGSTASAIGTIRTSKAAVICYASQCFGGAALEWYGQAFQENYLYFDLNNTATQTAAYLKSDACAADQENGYQMYNNGSNMSTLTLTGGVETATAYCSLNGKMALTVANSGEQPFTQKILNRAHTMTGALTVNANSTLYLGGGTTFPNVQTIKVDGGVLEIEAGTSPFTDYAVAFEIANGGKLKLPAGLELHVTCLKVNGVDQDGRFTGGSGFIEGDGALIGILPDPVTLTWASENPEATVSTSASWEGSPYIDLNYANKYTGVFAAAGSNAVQAVVDAAVNFRGLKFDAPTAAGFTIAASGESAAISLGTNGIETVLQDGVEANQVYTIEPPVTADLDQEWKIVSNTTVRLHDLTVNKLVDLTGKRCRIELSGTTTLNADLKNWCKKQCAADNKLTDTDDVGRTLVVTDTVEGPGTLWSNGWNGDVTVYSNAVVNAPVHWHGTGSHSWSYNWFVCPPGTTNEINGAAIGDVATYLCVQKNAQLTFSGGVSFGNKLSANNQGTVIVTGKPIVSTSVGTVAKPMTDENAFVGSAGVNGRFVFDVASNVISKVIATQDGSVVEFRKDYALAEDVVDRALPSRLDIGGSHQNAVFDLTNTRQRFRRLDGMRSDKATIRGVYPAALELFAASTNRSPIEGWVSIEKHKTVNGTGANDTLLLGGRAFGSAGDLKVTAGTIEFEANGSWPNGTNVVVSGTGIMKINQSQTFGKQAVIRLSDDGKLVIPDGMRQKVAACYVGETKIADGIYTYATAPDALKAHLEDTTGTLVVGKMGLMVILR